MKYTPLTFKLNLVGDVGVGKTSITNFFVHGKPTLDYISGLSVSFYTKSLKLKNHEIKLQVWDFVGYTPKLLSDSELRSTRGIFLVFDLTREETLEEIEKWLEVINRDAPEGTIIFLLGNKADLAKERIIFREIAHSLISRYGLDGYFETSAKSGHNINEVFAMMAERILG